MAISDTSDVSLIKSTVVLAVFGCYFALVSLTSIAQKSPTHDEPLHLFAGYAYLKWGDFRINPEHPPLAKALSALPLMMQDSRNFQISQAERDVVQQDRDYAWVLANRFLFSDSSGETRFFLGRLPMIGIGIILGMFVFIVARDLYGFTAAVAALVLYAFDPNVIAHSSIIHTDIPFALFLFCATYFFWRSLFEARVLNFLGASLFFACAAVTKFSFLAILPIWAALGLIRLAGLPPPRYESRPLLRRNRLRDRAILSMVVLAAAVVTAYVTIWCAYGFRYDAVAYQKGPMFFARLVSADQWLTTLVDVNAKYFVLPEAWVYGLVDALKSVNRPSYLLGQISDHGFWLYFPVAFAVKTPLPILLFLLTAVFLMLVERDQLRTNIFLLVPVVIYFSLAVFAKINIGLRHILPIYPFLFVWIGGAVGQIWLKQKVVGKCYVLALGLWLFVSSVKIYPDYLAFFNEIIGGPRYGHKVLVDSNLDWGQDLKGLKQWMEDHGIDMLPLAYFGTVDPSYYGIHAVHPVGSTGLPLGMIDAKTATMKPYIAISATHLAGLYLRQRDTYAKFREKEPVASIGHSILIYRADDEITRQAD